MSIGYGRSNTIGSGPMSHATGEDRAKNAGLTVEQLSRFLRDIDFQPAWRARADVEADYYDSNQYDLKTLQDMEQRGIPPVVINLIAPSINLILGMEEKTRQDWIVRADEEDQADFAMAMTKKLQEAERMTNADHACSEAYAGQVKAGLGWVHVRRQRMNPFGYPYVCEFVHRREIWWDWLDVSPTLERSRYLVRRKWYDFDVLEHWFPQHKDLILSVASGWAGFDARAAFDIGEPLFQDYQTERDFVFDIDTWRNMDRMQGCLYECWYRVPRRAYVLTMQNGIKAEFNPKAPNPVHVAALTQNVATVEWDTLMDMRLSWWLGPHRLVDKPSPLPHQDFPYVPFFGYREDRTAVPYGQIRAMKPLQDEVNARRARMLWQLSARRIVGFANAVRDRRTVEAEAARPDAAVWLDGDSIMAGTRGISELLRIEDNPGLNAQQMEAYRDAAERLQDVSSVFKEQLGKAGAADSGIAISQLIEQGTTGLAELNANHTMGRRNVGNQLFAFVKQDIGDKPMDVTVTHGSISRKKIKLNEPKVDEELTAQSGKEITYLNNDVMMTRASVVLDDVPASATFRQYQFKELAELVKKLPPELQAPMLDMVVQASDAPYKDEIVRRIRETLGIHEQDPEQMSPEEQAAYQEKLDVKEMMTQLERALQQLAVERADLENRQIDADTELTEADTLKTKVETQRLKVTPIEDPNKAPPPGKPGAPGAKKPAAKPKPKAAAAAK
jgi:hypothetical protein